jgi:hypothetical protein
VARLLGHTAQNALGGTSTTDLETASTTEFQGGNLCNMLIGMQHCLKNICWFPLFLNTGLCYAIKQDNWI